MPRYRQVINEDGSTELVEIGKPTGAVGHAVHGDIESFVSPLDGTVISDRKQYREHCKQHGVVPAAEFSKEHYERKAKERADFYEGNHSREEKWRRKAEINEIINRAERGLLWT